MGSLKKRKRVCKSKRTFESKHIALKNANRQWEKGYKLKPYKCDICNKYHLCKVGKMRRLELAFKEAGLEWLK